jgi:hypothetical protein
MAALVLPIADNSGCSVPLSNLLDGIKNHSSNYDLPHTIW